MKAQIMILTSLTELEARFRSRSYIFMELFSSDLPVILSCKCMSKVIFEVNIFWNYYNPRNYIWSTSSVIMLIMTTPDCVMNQFTIDNLEQIVRPVGILLIQLLAVFLRISRVIKLNMIEHSSILSSCRGYI